MNNIPNLVLLESKHSGYESVKVIEMERARNGGGIIIDRIQAQALALTFSEFRGVDIQAVHILPNEIRIFITREAHDERTDS